jgi:hypothetical protein
MLALLFQAAVAGALPPFFLSNFGQKLAHLVRVVIAAALWKSEPSLKTAADFVNENNPRALGADERMRNALAAADLQTSGNQEKCYWLLYQGGVAELLKRRHAGVGVETHHPADIFPLIFE